MVNSTKKKTAAKTQRYVALLRGVSPMNASMPALKAAFEAAGFENVVTVLSSGNVVFDAARASRSALEKRVLLAQSTLPRAFSVFVRSQRELTALLEAAPYRGAEAKKKRVITFLRGAPSVAPTLPPEHKGARIVAVHGSEAFSAYVPHPGEAFFMTVLERTFGKDITTRTWETVQKLSTR